MKIPRYEPMNPAGWDTHYVIAVDYDGTMTDYNGNLRDDMVEFVRYYKTLGCVVILWTSRYGNLLNEAIHLCAEKELYFDYINECPFRRSSNKISADIYIDDKSSDRAISPKTYSDIIDKALADGHYKMVDRA